MSKKPVSLRKSKRTQNSIGASNSDREGKLKPNDLPTSYSKKEENIDSTANQALLRRFDWNAVIAITSTIALVFLAVAAFYNAAQNRTARQIAQAQSVMEYYKLLQDYNDIQIKLVDGGEWSTPGTGPKTPEDWFRVRRYMGLLEQIEVLVETDVITIEIADANYSHRIRAIYNNDVIRQKDIEEQAFRWQQFLRLVKRLETMPVYHGLRERDESKKAAPNNSSSPAAQ